MSTKAARAADRLRRAEAFFAAYDRIVAEDRAAATFLQHNTAGVTLAQAGQHAAALKEFEAAVRLCPTFAEAWFNAGLAEVELRNGERAYEYFAQAVMLTPLYVPAETNLARLGEFVGLPRQIITPWVLDPTPSKVGALGRKLKSKLAGKAPQDFMPLDPDEAELRRQLAESPHSADGAFQLGRVLLRQKRYIEADAFLRYALRLEPWHERAALYQCLLFQLRGMWEELAEAAKSAIDRGATGDALHALGLWACLRICDWSMYRQMADHVAGTLEEDPEFVEPFMALHYTDDPRLQQQCATSASAVTTAGCTPLPASPRPSARPKLTIGYVSAEFNQHAVASLLVEVLELHDRNRFNINGYAIWPNDESSFGKRMRAACSKFTLLLSPDDQAHAHRIRADGVDILIDVTGLTDRNRARIIAMRPAPIQVNYLGYPGTRGTAAIDYAIVDKTIVSEKQKAAFTEALVYMPDTYQPNDRRKALGPSRLKRADYGLPAEGAVFCCFNETRKITPAVFAGWMRVLNRTPGAVLWLLVAGEFTRRRLKDAAAAHGVDPQRIVFASRANHEDHLGRYRVADLFLDTHPYNAHTTASDAMWLACPVLTLLGESFQSRVGASLAKAAGLPELIAQTPQDYEDLAVRVGTDAAFRAGLRAKLEANRAGCALFDTPRYVRHLEAAYEEMWRRYEAGEKPASFDVPPLPRVL